MEGPVLLAFVLASLVVLVTPGPGVFYVLTRSFFQGRRAGLVSVLGLSVGALFHVIAATVGLSAILLASATAFGVVKIVGAGYLIYLGVRTLRENSQLANTAKLKHASPLKIFYEGVLISIFNPKIAIFFLAFFPQFISEGSIPVYQQFLILGIIYVLLALFTDGTYALIADRMRRAFSNRRSLGEYLKFLPGITYIGLGLSLAVSDRDA